MFIKVIILSMANHIFAITCTLKALKKQVSCLAGNTLLLKNKFFHIHCLSLIADFV